MCSSDLLSHSAGFRAGTFPFGDDAPWQPFEPPSWEQLAAMMPYTQLDFAPGTKYSYSNPGYVYLGRVIEDVMQEPFETYIDKEILRPLGMTRAFFDRAPSFLRDQKSHSYFVDDKGRTEARFDFDTGITVMNGGLNAPVDDLAKYISMLAGSTDAATQARYDRIIKRATLEEMWQPVVPVSPGVSMGLGFFLEDHGGRRFIAHSGGPPIVMALLPRHMAPLAYAGTSAVFFATINFAKWVPYGLLGLLDGKQLATSAALMPVAAAGVLLGIRATKHVSPRWFYRLVQRGMFLTGVKLLWDALK